MVGTFKVREVSFPVAIDLQNRKAQSRAVKAKAPVISLDQPGRLRMANLMAVFNCSHTTIYQRIKTGEFPGMVTCRAAIEATILFAGTNRYVWHEWRPTLCRGASLDERAKG